MKSETENAALAREIFLSDILWLELAGFAGFAVFADVFIQLDKSIEVLILA